MCCYEKVVWDFNQGSFCAVMGKKTRLELFIKLINGWVGVEMQQYFLN